MNSIETRYYPMSSKIEDLDERIEQIQAIRFCYLELIAEYTELIEEL